MKKIETIQERLKYLRKDLLKLGQVEFSSQVGLKSSGFISQLEKGARNFTDRTISDICREFNVNEEWLRNGTGEIFQETDESIIAEMAKQYNLDNKALEIMHNFATLNEKERNMFIETLYKVIGTYDKEKLSNDADIEETKVMTFYDISINKNEHNYLKTDEFKIHDNEHKYKDLDYFDFPAVAGFANPFDNSIHFEKKTFKVNAITKEANLVVPLKGDSMEPTIKNNSYIFVKSQPTVEHNEIGIFSYNNESICKRLIKENNNIILRSDNPNYDDIILTEKDFVTCLGKVLYATKKECL